MGGAQITAARGTALVAATTVNVLDKTEKMLVSLAACRDRFELLVRSRAECHLPAQACAAPSCH
jgi:hypothetical protein